MVAACRRSALVTAMPAPAATRPSAAPMASVETSRSASALTATPPPARVTSAPSSMCACWLEWSVSTTTWPPTATTPIAPPKAIASLDEIVVASMRTSSLAPEPAWRLAFDVAPASTRLSTLRTRTETPTPTKPPAMLPARPKTSSLSRP